MTEVIVTQPTSQVVVGPGSGAPGPAGPPGPGVPAGGSDGDVVVKDGTDPYVFETVGKGTFVQGVAATEAEAKAGASTSTVMTPALAAEVLPYPDARQHGVVIDGVANDRLNLNTYIADCVVDNRPCFLRSGAYRISGGSLVGGGRILGAGRGRTVVRQADTNQGVLDFNSLSDWEVSDLTLESNAAATNYRTLQIRGAGDAGGVHRVQIVNGGLYVAGGGSSFNPGTATVNGTQTRLVLESVWVDDSDEYGISLESVRGVDLIAPQVTGAAIDGVKLLHSCDDVTITGGFATLCGQEGLDAFMGGYNLTIVGFKAYDNLGNGITVKSDDNLYAAGNFQPQGQTTLVGVICRGNSGSGITIDRNGSVDDPLVPLMMHVSLLGGVFEGNAGYGVKVRARNVSLVSPIVRRNSLHGIFIDPAAMDCEVVSPQVQANGQAAANTYDGIHVNGVRNRVSGGYSIGQDSDTIKNDGEYTGLVQQQRYGVVIIGGSTNCEVNGTTAFGNATGQVVSNDTDGLVRIRDRYDLVDAGGVRRTLAVDATGRLTIGGVVVGTQT